MKNLFVKKITNNSLTNIQEIGHILDTQTVANRIDIINWESYSYQSGVIFRIAHTGKEIWLKYEVHEKNILANETKINGDVYKDSCVEFFISFDKKNYYNLEFNCIGTAHVAFGPNRNNRTFISAETISKINVESSLGNQPFSEKIGNFNWQLILQIPLEIFSNSGITKLDGLKAFANFYKCGDATSTPHYITWNPVNSTEPDYHRPEFFGNLEFDK